MVDPVTPIQSPQQVCSTPQSVHTLMSLVRLLARQAARDYWYAEQRSRHPLNEDAPEN